MCFGEAMIQKQELLLSGAHQYLGLSITLPQCSTEPMQSL